MREKLSLMIQNAVGGCAKYWADVIADHLLAEGVIVPPCKVGDTIYKLCGNRIYEFTVHALSINDNINSCDILMCVYDEDNDNARYSCAWIGKTVFLTKEEAEKALAERSKENATAKHNQ